MAKSRAPAAPPVRKSFLVIGGVAIGCALLGFIVMNFLAGGGGGAEDDSAVLSTSNAPAASPGGAPAPGSDGAAAASASPTVPPNELVNGGRDPFDAGSLSATPAPAAPVQVAPVAPVPVQPQPQPTQPPAPQPTAVPQPTAAPAADPVIVGMKTVSASAADVWIDDTEHAGAAPGQELDARFSLQTIDAASRCATLHDAAASSGSQTFTLCENQAVRR